MRACVIGPAPPLRGGIAKHTAGLAAALRACGHEVTVLSYARMYPRFLFPGSAERDDCTPAGEALLDALSPATWVRTRSRLLDVQADVIVAQWWHPCAALALTSVLKGVDARVVVVCHNARPHERMPLWRALTRLILKRADVALCHSRFVASEILRLAPALRCDVTSMPLLIAPSGSVAVARSTGPTALFVGLVRRYKGVAVMLEAWERAQLPPGAQLVVAGESYLGPGKLGAMAAALRRRDSVRLIERWLDDGELWSLMLASDVLVLPYLRASQSGWLPLAAAAGVRVVATDAGGLAEALDRDGGHVVCRAGDSSALASALSRTLGEAVARRDAPRHQPPAASLLARSWAATVRACEHAAT